MKLYKIEIRNFRGIKLLDLIIGDTTVIIGENNTCKTSILEALRFALSVVRSQRGCSFEPFDFYLPESSSDPSTSEPISIRLTFDVNNEKLIKNFTRAKITQVIAQSGESKTRVIFKVGASYNRDSQEFVQNWEFQNIEGQAIVLDDKILTEFRNSISYFYLGALRDAARQFDAKGPFWRPFLQSAQIAPETQQKIEHQLEEINHLIINSHKDLTKVIDVLKNINDIVPTKNKDTDWVSVEAVPSRIFDILAKTQVHLNAETGAKIPLLRHGEGTQSLAVLMLFKAYLLSQKNGSPLIIALEEPEAHLHPSAIRSLWKIIEDLPGQKIISTHSGDILSEVPSDSIVRLNKNQGMITAHKLKEAKIDQDDLRKFNYKIKNDRGSLLFARCWILGEGQTESTIIPAAAKILGYDFEQLGIRVVGFQEGLSIKTAISVADAFGIRWVVLTDNDDKGKQFQNTVKNYLGKKNCNDVLFVMQENNIEQYLCNNPIFLPIYEKLKSDQRWERNKVSEDDPLYPEKIADALPDKKKTQAAMEVVEIMNKNENNIPPLIKDVIENAIKYAKEFIL
jgi:putative ATP-dependent endonuclease of OLD family